MPLHKFFVKANKAKKIFRAKKFAKFSKRYAKKRRMSAVYHAARKYHGSRTGINHRLIRSYNFNPRRHTMGSMKTSGLFTPWFKRTFA